MPICLRLFWQDTRAAACRVLLTATTDIEIRMERIAITTTSSISVNPSLSYRLIANLHSSTLLHKHLAVAAFRWAACRSPSWSSVSWSVVHKSVPSFARGLGTPLAWRGTLGVEIGLGAWIAALEQIYPDVHPVGRPEIGKENSHHKLCPEFSECEQAAAGQR